jgi:diaminohydroxyphosphoribosylaminopyrimidine deaminase / 5-amino-6-(5-phosphoribosylamino)uracil reductase
MRPVEQYVAKADADADTAWNALLLLAQQPPCALRESDRGPVALHGTGPAVDSGEDLSPSSLLDLYLPLLTVGPTAAIAHLGQSLDGRIATASGASHYVTGEQDILHNHRMRALCDAVLVGAGTVRHDDPQLTVRLCAGRNPVRVIVDTERRLDIGYQIFRDGCAETLLLTAEDKATAARHGDAEVIGIPRRGQGLCPASIRQTLAARGLPRLFIEGGGITVSRFLEAGGLDFLQVTIAPLIIGSGRMGISLPRVETLSESIRPAVRYFRFGADLMIECDLRTDGA